MTVDAIANRFNVVGSAADGVAGGQEYAAGKSKHDEDLLHLGFLVMPRSACVTGARLTRITRVPLRSPKPVD
jgi:hypothetical protein